MAGNPFRQVVKRAAEQTSRSAGGLFDSFGMSFNSLVLAGGASLLGLLGYDGLFNGMNSSLERSARRL